MSLLRSTFSTRKTRSCSSARSSLGAVAVAALAAAAAGAAATVAAAASARAVAPSAKVAALRSTLTDAEMQIALWTVDDHRAGHALNPYTRPQMFLNRPGASAAERVVERETCRKA